MTKTLTVHNAELQTATVEVKTLTISGKQVTLAVFRQLLVANPFDNQAKWRGEPWGFVNYLNDDPTRRHVVWQSGSELRRFLVYIPERSFAYHAERMAIKAWQQDRDQSEPEDVANAYIRDIQLSLMERWGEVLALPQLFIAV